MATLAEIREQYPQYADMPDADLAGALHKKFYSDMPRDDFDKKLGIQATPKQPGFFDKIVSAVTDVPSEIGGAANSALTTITDKLNPFSEARTQRIQSGGLSGQLQNILDTGSGLAAIPSLIASPITGAARSLIGHPYSAVTGMPYEQAKDAVDTAMMAAAPRSATPIGVKTQARIPSAQELKDTARAAYQSPEVKGLKIDPYSVDLLGAKIDAELASRGFRPTANSAADTLAEINRLRRDPKSAPVSVDDLDNTRKALGITAKQKDPIGQPTPDAAAAKAAIRSIDDYLTKLNPVDVVAGDAVAANAKLTEARGNYSAGKRASEIDFRLDKAERQAARSGSGMNLENARRQKIDQVSEYGLTPQEVALRDKIVLGSPMTNTLRTAGKLGVDGGLSLLLNAGAAIGSGGATLPITAAGTAARLAGQALTKSQIKKLNEMIRSRAPMTKSLLPAPVEGPGGLLGALYAQQFPSNLLSASVGEFR
jgi:hypothetical protein